MRQRFTPRGLAVNPCTHCPVAPVCERARSASHTHRATAAYTQTAGSAPLLGANASALEVIMSKWSFAVGVAFVLGGACTMPDEMPFSACAETLTSCRVVSGLTGYQRACTTTCAQQRPPRDDDDDNDEDEDTRDAPILASGAAVPAPDSPADDDGAIRGASLGPAALPDPTRYSSFDIPCERDSQCGPGKCEAGNCYYGCQSDAQCGSGDRCAVESGTRICQPDPNPPVQCTRTAQCDDGFTCLNGACRQACTSTDQCTNLVDRCGSGVCLPDRRPLGECVLNSECADGLVCMDGACVPACPDGADGGVCLAEQSQSAPAPQANDDGPGAGEQEPVDTGEGETSPTPETPAQPAADAGAPLMNIR